jgi:uncharacterized protein (TIGR02118 family)
MICVSVLYPNTPAVKFDYDYYAQKHMPLVVDRLKSLGMVRYEIDRGLGGGAPGSAAPFDCIGRLYFNKLEEFQESFAKHGAELLADIPNYTDAKAELQVGEVV